MSPLTLNEMKDRVRLRVADLFNDFACVVKNTKYDVVPPKYINFDLRGTTSGRSTYKYNSGYGYLEFNPVLMMENWDEFDRTIIHEVAHYCVSIMYGQIFTRGGSRVVHGKEWKRMMRFFGIEPKRCHSYDVSNVKTRTQRKHKYVCGCTEHMISTRRHNRILQGCRYRCNICKEVIIKKEK